MTVRGQPSTTWRAVSHTPRSATENAVPAPGPRAGARTQMAGSNRDAGAKASPASGARDGADRRSGCARRQGTPMAANAKPATTVR